jgi:DNA polymerase
MKRTEGNVKASLRNYLQILDASGVDTVLFPPSNPGSAVRTGSFVVNERQEHGSTDSGWNELEALAKACTKCQELARTRKNVVFGSGNRAAKLVFVGEAPGFEEDVQGFPFVGAAGMLLTKMIQAIGFSREEVYICNVLKCRPPGNRNPMPSEVSNCSPFLWKQLELLQPAIICSLGTFAAQALLQSMQPVSRLRGIVHEHRGYRIVCTFHPAYLLRSPGEKRKAWEDLKKVRHELTACTS